MIELKKETQVFEYSGKIRVTTSGPSLPGNFLLLELKV